MPIAKRDPGRRRRRPARPPVDDEDLNDEGRKVVEAAPDEDRERQHRDHTKPSGMYAQPIVKAPDGTKTKVGHALDLGNPEDWKIAQQECANGNHDPEPDDTDPAFHAEKCRVCGTGRLLAPKSG